MNPLAIIALLAGVFWLIKQRDRELVTESASENQNTLNQVTGWSTLNVDLPFKEIIIPQRRVKQFPPPVLYPGRFGGPACATLCPRKYNICLSGWHAFGYPSLASCCDTVGHNNNVSC